MGTRDKARELEIDRLRARLEQAEQTLSAIRGGAADALVVSSPETGVTDHKRVEGALLRAYDELEIRVRERTAELEQANQALQQEIAERTRAEQELRATQVRLQFFLSATPAMIYTCKPGGDRGVTYFGANLAAQLGYEPREFLEDSSFWANHIHPEDAPRVFAELPSLIEKEHDVYEYRFLHKDGTYRWMRDEARLIRDAGGNPLEIVGYWIDITKRKRAEIELEKTSNRLRNLAAHLESVREEQGAKIAREVHDELGGTLTMLKLGLASVLEKLEEADALRKKLAPMLELIDGVIQRVKRISTSLRPIMLDTLGLTATLKWHVNEFSALTGIRNELRMPQYIRLSPERSTAVFRIIQETLTNVARHAEATKVTIRLSKHKGRLLVEIADNGKGVTEDVLSKPEAFGILGMRERSQFLSGELNIEGVSDQGTKLTLSFPLEPKR